MFPDRGITYHLRRGHRVLRPSHGRPLDPYRRIQRIHIPRPDRGHGPDNGALEDLGYHIRCVLHGIPGILRADRHRMRPGGAAVSRRHHGVRGSRHGRRREALRGVRTRLPGRDEEALREGGRPHAESHRALPDARTRMEARTLHTRIRRGDARAREGFRSEAHRSHRDKLREGSRRSGIQGLRDRGDRGGHEARDPRILSWNRGCLRFRSRRSLRIRPPVACRRGGGHQSDRGQHPRHLRFGRGCEVRGQLREGPQGLCDQSVRGQEGIRHDPGRQRRGPAPDCLHGILRLVRGI